MNGYQARIFEMHTQPGGLCTAWKRKGYTFDGCIHHLAGAGPASTLYRVWQELGIFQRHQMTFYDSLMQTELPDGKTLTTYTDIDRLDAYLRGDVATGRSCDRRVHRGGATLPGPRPARHADGHAGGGPGLVAQAAAGASCLPKSFKVLFIKAYVPPPMLNSPPLFRLYGWAEGTGATALKSLP